MTLLCLRLSLAYLSIGGGEACMWEVGLKVPSAEYIFVTSYFSFKVKSWQELIMQPRWCTHPLPPLVPDLRYQWHQSRIEVLLRPEDFTKSRNLILWMPRAEMKPLASRSIASALPLSPYWYIIIENIIVTNFVWNKICLLLNAHASY